MSQPRPPFDPLPRSPRGSRFFEWFARRWYLSIIIAAYSFYAFLKATDKQESSDLGVAGGLGVVWLIPGLLFLVTAGTGLLRLIRPHLDPDAAQCRFCGSRLNVIDEQPATVCARCGREQ